MSLIRGPMSLQGRERPVAQREFLRPERVKPSSGDRRATSALWNMFRIVASAVSDGNARGPVTEQDELERPLLTQAAGARSHGASDHRPLVPGFGPRRPCACAGCLARIHPPEGVGQRSPLPPPSSPGVRDSPPAQALRAGPRAHARTVRHRRAEVIRRPPAYCPVADRGPGSPRPHLDQGKYPAGPGARVGREPEEMVLMAMTRLPGPTTRL